MDALYFRVSSEPQTTENQFEDLLQVAEKDDSGRDWRQIRQALSDCIVEEERRTRNGKTRTVYGVRPEITVELARQCVYVEQGKSSKAGSRCRPQFEQMKRDAVRRQLLFPVVLPQEYMLPKRACRRAYEVLSEEFKRVDKRRFPRLLWCYLSGG
jgi:hypothetical protein